MTGERITFARSQQAPPLLLIVGSDRDSELMMGPEPIPVTGGSDLSRLIDHRTPYCLMHVTKDYFDQAPCRPNLLPFRTVLNLVTDPDQNPRVLANVENVLGGFAGRIINRPDAVLCTTRDKVARLLDGVPNLIVPRVLRLAGAKREIVNQALARSQLRFPVLLRRAGTHSGEFIGRFDTTQQVVDAFEQEGDHIITEFVDFASVDGLYRKYRVFFIGTHLIFRHMLVSDRWNVHASARTEFMASRPELIAEEERILAHPSGGLSEDLVKALQEVRARMPLDYFGMDFGIAADGELLLFEANATMNFLPFLDDPCFDYVRQSARPAQYAIHELIDLPVA